MDQILYFISHPTSFRVFLYFKIVFMAVSLAFLFFVFILFSKASWFKRRFLEDITEFVTYRPFGAKEAFKSWIKINKRLESGKESEYKLAVIETDDLLDSVLEKMNYQGETIEEKLKQLDPAILPNINEVIQARKVRNNIVYDPDYRLTLEEAKKTLEVYEEAFRYLELF